MGRTSKNTSHDTGKPKSKAPVNRSDKVRYVLGQLQTRNHECHWPGCKKQVPPAMWGCYQHWMTLPKRLRDKIWAAYEPGQEVTMTPSREYLKVAQEVQEWIKSYEQARKDRQARVQKDVSGRHKGKGNKS